MCVGREGENCEGQHTCPDVSEQEGCCIRAGRNLIGCLFNPYVLNEESEAVVRARGPMALTRVASLFPIPVPLAVCSLATWRAFCPQLAHHLVTSSDPGEHWSREVGAAVSILQIKKLRFKGIVTGPSSRLVVESELESRPGLGRCHPQSSNSSGGLWHFCLCKPLSP